MKKCIALVVASLSFGAFADSYLYWFVGDSVSVDRNENFTGYSTAKVGVVDSSGTSKGYLNLFVSDGDSTVGASIGMTPGDNSPYFANLGSYGKEGYSFYIELFNDAQESVGRSNDFLKYADALAYITSFGTSTPSNPWTVTNFTTQAVPEPNSALLILLGCAGLALKRKKQAKA